MKRILIVTCVFPPEPVTSATLNYDLAVELGKDYEVTVVTPHPSRPKGFDFSNTKTVDSGAFNHIVVDSYIHPESSFIGRMRESVSFGNASVRYIEKHHEEIDFVYNDGWQLFGLYLVAKSCKKYNIPYIVPIQDIYPESLLTKLPNILGLHSIIKGLLGRFDKYYIEHAAAVRTISDGMAEYLSRTRELSRDRFLVIANWQNDDEYADWDSGCRQNNKTVFMFVGNNNKQANVELIIRAFEKAKMKDAELQIMGEGNAKRDCQSLAEELKCENVVFGSVPVGDVANTQRKADVMVLALKAGTGNQGVPSKLTSYMMSGKPVLASMEANSDAAKMILEAKAGMVTPADDVESLASAFKIMAEKTDDTLKQMGENSRHYAEQHLSRKSNLQLLKAKIESII